MWLGFVARIPDPLAATPPSDTPYRRDLSQSQTIISKSNQVDNCRIWDDNAFRAIR